MTSTMVPVLTAELLSREGFRPAYDVQKISRYGAGGVMDSGNEAIRKGAILGALTLYLDVINLFLSLLRLMGDRR